MEREEREVRAFAFAHGYLAGQPLTAEQNKSEARRIQRWADRSLASLYQQILQRPAGAREVAEGMANLVARAKEDHSLRERQRLLDLARELHERDEPLPAPLQQWIVETLQRPPPASPHKRGPDPVHHHGRDAAIIRAVNWIVETYSLAPTRNPEHRAQRGYPESACSIVARALGAHRVNISESAVEAIWNKRPKNYSGNSSDD
jgi:hypothetical protein